MTYFLVRGLKWWRYSSTPPIQLHGLVLNQLHRRITLHLPVLFISGSDMEPYLYSSYLNFWLYLLMNEEVAVLTRTGKRYDTDT
jgi:hypothetical protein